MMQLDFSNEHFNRQQGNISISKLALIKEAVNQ